MVQTVRDTIRSVVRKHLIDSNGLVFGQCLTAVGWVGGTLPELYEEDGMVELSMADVSGGAIAVGAALMNRRPMYVIRYQGFNWYNCTSIVNYACKSKELWKIPCPMFIRSIAMEGGVGPVAGSSHHALYHRMPGIKIISPMTPVEYKGAYNAFMADDDVYYISEHRGSYDNSYELDHIWNEKPDIVIFAISITRFSAIKACELLQSTGIKVGLIHIVSIKPLKISDEAIVMLSNAKHGGLILDDDYEDGVMKSIAHSLMTKTGKKIYCLGLENRSAGFASNLDNLPPSPGRIVDFARDQILEPLI